MNNSISILIIGIICQGFMFGQNMNPYPMPCYEITNSEFPANGLSDQYREANCFTFNKTISQLVFFYTQRNIDIHASEEIYIDEEVLINSATPIGPNANGIYMHVEPISHELAWFEPSNTPFSVGKYEKMEIGVSLPKDIRDRIQDFIENGNTATSINPFLEWEIRLVADFYRNGVYQKSVDGFYYQEFERDLTDSLIQDHHWNNLGQDCGWNGDIDFNFRVRAALPETGNWHCIIRMELPGQAPKYLRKVDFTVTPSSNPGFVKVGTNKRYFTLDGETFFFVGQNVGWPDLSDDCKAGGDHRSNCQPHNMSQMFCNGISQPDDYLNFYEKIEDMSSQINFVRTLMVPWSWEIEFEQVGNYKDRMHMAWEMDRFFEICKEEDIRINFDLSWGIEMTNSGSARNWDFYDQPDNVVNPLTEHIFGYMAEFGLNNQLEYFTSDSVKKYYEQKLRYLVSRYGYSTNMALIEIGNEMNTKLKDINDYDQYNTTAGQTAIYDWHSFVSDKLRNRFKVDQLIAANYVNGYVFCVSENECSGLSEYDRSYSLPNVDVASFNFYVKTGLRDNIDMFFKFNRKYVGQNGDANPYYNLNKPVIIAESGDATYIMCATDHNNGYKDALMLCMSGYAGVTLWDDQPSYYSKYRMLQNFMNEIDLDGEDFRPYLTHPEHEKEGKSLANMKRKDEKTIFYHLRSYAHEPYKAVGVIHNRTYNPYSMRDIFFDDNTLDANNEKTLPPHTNYWKPIYPCADSKLNFLCDDLTDFTDSPFKYISNIVDIPSQKLELHDMSNGNYEFNYYNAFDLSWQHTSWDNGSKKRIEYPTLTYSNRILLFKAWKDGGATFSQLNNKATQLEDNKMQHNISVFDSNYFHENNTTFMLSPNLVKCSEVISLKSNKPLKNFCIFDNLGRVVNKVVTEENICFFQFDNPGIYFLVVTKNNEVVYRQKIIVSQ